MLRHLRRGEINLREEGVLPTIDMCSKLIELKKLAYPSSFFNYLISYLNDNKLEGIEVYNTINIET